MPSPLASEVDNIRREAMGGAPGPEHTKVGAFALRSCLASQPATVYLSHSRTSYFIYLTLHSR